MKTILIRDGNAGRPGPFRPGPQKARIVRASPARPAYLLRATLLGPPRTPVGPQARGPARFFFEFLMFLIFNFYDKTFNVQKIGKF